MTDTWRVKRCIIIKNNFKKLHAIVVLLEFLLLHHLTLNDRPILFVENAPVGTVLISLLSLVLLPTIVSVESIKTFLATRRR